MKGTPGSGWRFGRQFGERGGRGQPGRLVRGAGSHRQVRRIAASAGRLCEQAPIAPAAPYDRVDGAVMEVDGLEDHERRRQCERREPMDAELDRAEKHRRKTEEYERVP